MKSMIKDAVAYEQTMNALRQWDDGQNLWSISLGGLGPSYEQCIQATAWEIIRDNLDKGVPEEKEFKSFGDATFKRLEDHRIMGGHSGATADAAKWLAYRILEEGYGNFKARLEKERKDRMIQICKRF